MENVSELVLFLGKIVEIISLCGLSANNKHSVYFPFDINHFFSLISVCLRTKEIVYHKYNCANTRKYR